MTYLYKCDECKHKQEVDLPMADVHPEYMACPKCGEITMKKVFIPSVIHTPFQWTKDTYGFDKRSRTNRKYR